MNGALKKLSGLLLTGAPAYLTFTLHSLVVCEGSADSTNLMEFLFLAFHARYLWKRLCIDNILRYLEIKIFSSFVRNWFYFIVGL